MDEIENLVGGVPIPVALEHRGEPRRLPAVVGRGALRVVRDALDGAANASVAIEFMPGALAVEVEGDGDGRDLGEVADLAAALGGGLRAVKRPGGFRVRAWLPTEGQPPCHAAPRAAR
jgi:hypothetical protein